MRERLRRQLWKQMSRNHKDELICLRVKYVFVNTQNPIADMRQWLSNAQYEHVLIRNSYADQISEQMQSYPDSCQFLFLPTVPLTIYVL